MSNKEIKVGDIVRYIGKRHDTDPEVNPPVGTLGKVLRETRTPDSVLYFIQWEKGSTSDDDCWYQYPEEVELVEDIKVGKTGKAYIDFNVSDEEIWEMLKPKMEKNGLIPYWGEKELAYYQSNVAKAIATAYRSGYLRAMKGRPFKIGEKKAKKQGGHWEPVDPENLPKEGTKVRYARECRDYSEDALYNFGTSVVEIGDTGHVNVSNDGWFGIRLDNPRSIYSWLSFDDNGMAASLDMWMEDDE